MEFFRMVKAKVQESDIQRTLSLSNLEAMSNDMFVIGNQSKDKASIGGVWGEFTLTRSEIKGGLRFALAECPNALCWTVTTGFPPDPNAIVIHLTINRLQKEASFIKEIEAFLEDHKDCLLEIYA